MPEEDLLEIEATVMDVAYKNVEKGHRMDTLLTVAFPLLEEDHEETITLYGPFSFEKGQKFRLHYRLVEERSLLKRSSHYEIEKMDFGRFPIFVKHRISLE